MRYRPPLPNPHLARPRLVERALQQRITLLVAPAGYGKSVALTEVVHSAAGEFGWHELSAADRDPDRLLANLARALRAPQPWQGGADALCQWAAGQPHLSGLALDRIELLADSEEATRLLGALLTGAPSTFRLLLAGRSLPNIPGLARLRLCGDVAEIGAQDLLFTQEESQAYIVATGAGHGAEELAGGWPAALRLLGRPPEPAWTEFFGYLESEVLASLPTEQRQQLRDCGVITDWSPQACARLLAGGEQVLREWERILPVDRPGRIHGLIRRYARARLEAEPERARALHRKAARWMAEDGDLGEALTHALAADDLGLAVPLLGQVGGRLLAEGQVIALETLLDQAGGAVLESVPELLLQLGELLRRAGCPRRASRWLRLAAVGFASEDDGGGLYRAFCRLALTHADLGEWSEMQAALRQIEAEAAEATGRDRAEALRALAEYDLHQGRQEAAATRYRESAALFLAHGDPEGAGAALVGLGAGALVAIDRLEEALSALREAQRLEGGAASADALLAEVQLLVYLERWEEAELLLATAVPKGLQQRALVVWLSARVALRQGDRGSARELKEEGDQLAAIGELRPVDQGTAALTEGWLTLAEGKRAEALACAKQVLRLVSGGLPLLRRAGAQLLAAAEERISRTGDPANPSEPGDRLRAECLGAFRLFHGEQEVPVSHWGRAQVRGVLQFLLLQPGFTAPREALLEAFWPGEPPTQSRSRLRVVLNRLRQALLPLGCTLEAGTEVIRLPREAIAGVDLLTLREHLAAARDSVREDPEGALNHCRAGQALCRGPLLADAFWPGLEEHRQLVHREATELLRLWQEAALRAGRTEEAITALEQLVHLEPGEEEAASQLMRLLIKTGRRTDALRRYRQLARWLKEELGLDPSPQTQELFRRALH